VWIGRILDGGGGGRCKAIESGLTSFLVGGAESGERATKVNKMAEELLAILCKI